MGSASSMASPVESEGQPQRLLDTERRANRVSCQFLHESACEHRMRTLYAPHFAQTKLTTGEGPRGRGKPAFAGAAPRIARPRPGWVSWGMCACQRPVTRSCGTSCGTRHSPAGWATSRPACWWNGSPTGRNCSPKPLETKMMPGRASTDCAGAAGPSAASCSFGASPPVAARPRNSPPPNASAGRSPTTGVDPGDLMHHILSWENQHPEG